MDKELQDKLIKYLNKKGLIDIKVDPNDYIDVFYCKYEIKFRIRLEIYSSKHIKYSSPDVSPKYKNHCKYVTYYRKADWRRRGGEVRRRVGGDDINNLKTSYNRKDINTAVYKNILLIQTWLDPILEQKKKTREELNDYASELKFYFNDKYGKYGDVKLSISGNETKKISAQITNSEGAIEYHNMLYEDGNYFLESINTYWRNWNKEKKVYTQRKKKEKV